MEEMRKHMKPSRFIMKYFRLIFGGIIIVAILFCAIAAPLLTNYDPNTVVMQEAKQTPSEEHFLGTDIYGRDIWARILYGSRLTLIVSISSVVFTIIVGTILGLLCGYYPKVEKYLMRFLDAFSTIPNILLCLIMISVLGAGVVNLIIAMGIHGIPGVARMVRNQVLSLREKEFIESEVAMGASDIRTIFVHILPSLSSYLLVRMSSGLAGSVLSMTSLTYLGVGLDPTLPSWGGMVMEGQKFFITTPHIIFFPALAICLIAFAFAMVGDGVRDLLDPRLR